MKRFLRYFICVILIFTLVLGNLCFAQSEKPEAKVPKLSGLFVAPQLCTGDNSWNEDDWTTALKEMKDAGMDKVVLQYAVQYYSDTYKTHYYEPSFEKALADNTDKHNQISYALKAAKNTGVKVYIGLLLAEDPWFASMSTGFQNTDFLTFSAQYTVKLFDDLSKNFSKDYSDVIEGWYLPFEYNNTEVFGDGKDRLINNFYVPVTTHIKKENPNKRILVSPLVYASITEKASSDSVNNWYQLNYDMYTKAGVDIIAPQDGCGWESTVKENLEPWYEALYRAANDAKKSGRSSVEAWNNPECYNMNGTSTMTAKRLTDNMSAVDKYVTAHISFSSASVIYLGKGKNGTNVNNKAYYEAYKYAFKNSKLYVPKNKIDTPSKVSATCNDGINVTLKWKRVEQPNSDLPIAGYYVYREIDGTYKRVKEVEQSSEKEISIIDYNLTEGKKYSYKIYAFDGTGNVSEKPAEVSVTTDTNVAVFNRENKKTVENYSLSQGKAINCELKAGNLSRLFDGLLGTKFKNPDTDNGNTVLFAKTDNSKVAKISIEISLKQKETLGFIYLQMISQPTQDIYLPERIDIKGDGKIIKTVYPLREYKDVPAGTVWIPIDFETAVKTSAVTVDMLLKNKYIAASELKLYSAKPSEVSKNYSEPENKLSGQTVIVTEYTVSQNFSPDAHFGGNKVSLIDYEKGDIKTDYLKYKECYSTKNITRGSLNPAMLRWLDDGDRTHWFSIADIGETYELNADLRSPSTVKKLETVWMYDRDAAVFLPSKIEYYGTTLEGKKVLIGTSYPPSTVKIDFDKAPSQDNMHFITTEKYAVVNQNTDVIYKQVTAKVYPEYPSNTQFISNFNVY